MKVVLFCGGLGMRMRADNQSLPKPMMPIVNRPMMEHIITLLKQHGFARIYDFLSQIIDYGDTRVEKLAIYLKLLARLVKNPDWDIGLQKTGYIREAGLRAIRSRLEKSCHLPRRMWSRARGASSSRRSAAAALGAFDLR